MNKLALVSDTSLLLYLGRIDRIQLLPMLYEPIYVPEPVLWELDTGRLLRSNTVDPREIGWVNIVAVSQTDLDLLPANRLGYGEKEVIAYGKANENCVVGLDDRQARLFAGELGIQIVGLIGLLIKAKRRGLVRVVEPLLGAAQASGFYISDQLYQVVIELAGES
jgi:hypothetical protein